MKHSLALALILALPLAAQAEVKPIGSTFDGRIKAVNYNPQDVVKIVGRYGYSTLIQFAPDEVITDIALGDTLAWEVAPSTNMRSVFLKPREDKAATNLQVITDKHVYHFMLEAHHHAANPTAYSAFSVRFQYPEQEAAKRRAEEAERQARAALNAPAEPKNWNYWGCGTQQLRPVQVYDDGRFTYMRFPGAQEIPAVFLINADGTESLTNGQMRGDEFVVYATAPKFVLRKGKSVACIENRAFNWYGVNTPGSTTSPYVDRQVKAAPVTLPQQATPGVRPAAATSALPDLQQAIPGLEGVSLPSPFESVPAPTGGAAAASDDDEG